MINRTKRGLSIATGIYGILFSIIHAVASFYLFSIVLTIALSVARAEDWLIFTCFGGGIALVGISVAYFVLSIFMILKPKVDADGEYKYRKGVNIALIALVGVAFAITSVIYALTGGVESEEEIKLILSMLAPTIVYGALLILTFFIKDKREPAPSEFDRQESD